MLITYEPGAEQCVGLGALNYQRVKSLGLLEYGGVTTLPEYHGVSLTARLLGPTHGQPHDIILLAISGALWEAKGPLDLPTVYTSVGCMAMGHVILPSVDQPDQLRLPSSHLLVPPDITQQLRERHRP